jgi:hypothetical protein
MIVARGRRGGHVSTEDAWSQTPAPGAEPPDRGAPTPGVRPDDWTAPTELALPVVRPGPAVLDADSWEEHGGQEPIEEYEGRRRAARPSARRWVVLAAILIGLAAVIAVPLALRTRNATPAAATATTGEPTADETAPASAASLVPPVGVAAVPATSTNTGRTGPTSRGQTTTSGQTGAFSVTLEAEGPGVTLYGSARVDTYPGASGGSIVRNLGKWDSSPGSIRFNVTLPSTGSYVITIWYVHLDGERTRSAQISVSGADPVTKTFIGSATCCASLALAPMNLAAGAHTVTIANPTGHAPSVDKIVIGRA